MCSRGSTSCSIVSAASTPHPHVTGIPITALPPNSTQPNSTSVIPYTIYTPTTHTPPAPTNLPPNSHPLYTPPIYTPTPHQHPTCVITSVSTTSLHPTDTHLTSSYLPTHSQSTSYLNLICIPPMAHQCLTHIPTIPHPHPIPTQIIPTSASASPIHIPPAFQLYPIYSSGSLKSKNNTEQLNSSKHQR